MYIYLFVVTCIYMYWYVVLRVSFKYFYHPTKFILHYSSPSKVFQGCAMISKVTFQGRNYDCASMCDFKGFFRVFVVICWCLLPLAVGLDIVAVLPLVLLPLLQASRFSAHIKSANSVTVIVALPIDLGHSIVDQNEHEQLQLVFSSLQ